GSGAGAGLAARGLAAAGPGAGASFASSGMTWSGRTVSTTLRQSARSSAPSLRIAVYPFDRAARQQQPGAAVRLHAAGDPRCFLAGAPEGVEAVGAADRAAGILRDPQAVRERIVHVGK